MSGGRETKIAIQGLEVCYHGRRVLGGIDLGIPRRSLVCLVGPSGCGKSTLLMTLNRLLDTVPHASWRGRVRLHLDDGRCWDLATLPAHQLVELRRKVALVFQQPSLLPGSIQSNVAFPLLLRKTPTEQVRTKTRQALELVGLWDEVKDRLDQGAEELSGGQQQRLCLARALVMEPEVLLLDEPTSFLDRALARRVESLLLEQRRQRTVVVVSHYSDRLQDSADLVFELNTP